MAPKQQPASLSPISLPTAIIFSFHSVIHSPVLGIVVIGDAPEEDHAVAIFLRVDFCGSSFLYRTLDRESLSFPCLRLLVPLDLHHIRLPVIMRMHYSVTINHSICYTTGRILHLDKMHPISSLAVSSPLRVI